MTVRDSVPMAIDFCNPAPDAEAASDMAIRKAREHPPSHKAMARQAGDKLDARRSDRLVNSL